MYVGSLELRVEPASLQSKSRCLASFQRASTENQGRQSLCRQFHAATVLQVVRLLNSGLMHAWLSLTILYAPVDPGLKVYLVQNVRRTLVIGQMEHAKSHSESKI